MEMFLTDKELEQLTRKKRKAGQLKELLAMNIKFRKRLDGSLVVFYSDLGSHTLAVKPKDKFIPNWDAINA